MDGHLADKGPVIDNVVWGVSRGGNQLEGVDIRCLIDIGAAVSSSITESFYKEVLAHSKQVVDVSSYINISASQGLAIPYVGYVELYLTVLYHTFKG